MKDIARGFWILASVLVLTLSYVYATATDPVGPQSIVVEDSERLNASNYPSVQIDAEAGNITRLTITALTQTQSWQGYYGEVSGNITLDDADNNTFYRWEIAEPQGEIYASNGSTVTWSRIACANYTNDGTGATHGFNLTHLEEMFGINDSDADGVNETFLESGLLDGAVPHPEFFVGTYTISAGTCPATDMYENDLPAGHNFTEVLLTDNESIIFTAIIENDDPSSDADIPGFDGQTTDFQMLVGEDGHDGDDSVTPYYFFVELE